jgi:hypothetical protein
MYIEHTAADYRAHLGLAEDYTVDGVLMYGTWDLEAEANQVPLFEKALADMNISYKMRKLEAKEIGHAYEFMVDDKRYWFVPVMGCAVLAMYLHYACLLGSQRNILLGIVGGLAPGMKTSDFVSPVAIHGNDNAKYYDRENITGLYHPDTTLQQQLESALPGEQKTWEGITTTCEMMLAETRDDVERWSAAGILGVEMEGALTFAISSYFNVAAAALFYVADNLISEETMIDENYTLGDARRLSARKLQYMAGLQTLLNKS